MSASVRLKTAVKNKLYDSGYLYDFYLARYMGNTKKELLTIAKCFFQRRKHPALSIFADYSTGQCYNIAALREELEKYDVISFDVFDTLLLRRTPAPTDVFLLVEKETSCPGFTRKRQLAESNARLFKCRETGSREVTLQEIYETPPLNNIADIHQQMLAELQAEHRVCYANEELNLLVKELAQAGKQVIAVSDMYLPKTEIHELLRKNGYPEIKQLYVSCEYGISKSDGKLFDVVKEKLGRQKTICHIGDNFYSDVMAEKGKITKAIHYIKNEEIKDSSKNNKKSYY